jgi:hypothetical protein
MILMGVTKLMMKMMKMSMVEIVANATEGGDEAYALIIMIVNGADCG